VRKILTISFLAVTTLVGQETTISQFTFQDSTYKVRQIIFTGNELTKDYIIEREMSLRRDSLITYQAVQYDIDRIYSLQLFTKVDIQVVPDSSDYATLAVLVNERWYLFPFPVLGFKDRDWEKLYYGAGIIHSNVAGRNVQMFGSFALGYDPYVSVGYTNPYIDIENRIFFSFRSYYTEKRNRSIVSLAGGANFDEITWGGVMSVGKRFSLFTWASATLEYKNLRVSEYRAGRTASPSGRDEFFSLHAGYLYDTRDFKEYPGAGTFLSLGISKYGMFEGNVNYQRYNIDVRKFLPLGFDIVLGGRAFTSLVSGGMVPNYDNVFFGYSERLRGHFNTILEGEQIIGSTVEMHYPLLSPRYVRMDFIPFEQFRDIRYAIYAAAFADAGSAWYRKNPLTLKALSSGYGAGIHFNFAYSAVLRFEVGFPTEKSISYAEFIFGLGAAL